MSNVTLPQIRGKYRFNASLANMCWFGVGGSVDVLFIPIDQDDLIYFLNNYKLHLPIFTLGVGSNILVRDSGFKGVIIRLGRGFNYISLVDKDKIRVGAAVMDLNLALFARDNAIEGLEFLSGIPGTIGGALSMNAGAYQADIASHLLQATAINRQGVIKIFEVSEIGYQYRSKALSDEWIFTEAIFQGTVGSKERISKKIEHICTERSNSQPVRSKTGGSTFKNPPSHSAWKLIDEAGCRGLKIGGASVSNLHCNFIINEGDATAKDLENLINIVKEKVYNNSGILLQEEIKIIGE